MLKCLNCNSENTDKFSQNTFGCFDCFCSFKIYEMIYKEYIIELNEYPHTELKYQGVPIEYTGCEWICHGKTIEDCKTQIDELDE